MERNYIFPKETEEAKFKFGKPTERTADLKGLLYTSCNIEESDETKHRYMKSHNSFQPGEQKSRNYEWPMDKRQMTFGRPLAKELAGTEKSLKYDTLKNAYPTTTLVSKRFNDFILSSENILGKQKYKGSLRNSIDDNTTYGCKSQSKDAWNVGKLILLISYTLYIYRLINV